MKLTLGMSNLKFSLSETHPNKMIIEGCLTKIGQPSDGAPMGSDGRRIVFTKESIDKCAETYEMMPINVTFPDDWDWTWCPGTEVFTGHGDVNIGVIQKVWSENEDLMAQIIVWKGLFPSISFMTINAKDSLGFSIECNADKTHDGTEDGYLYIDEFTGLGAAMLFKNVAAFSGTYIKELVASLQNKPNVKVEDNMNEEQMKELLAGLMTDIKASIDEVKASVESKVDSAISEVKAEVVKANTEIETLAVSLAETKEEIKASKVEPQVITASAEPVVEPPAPAVIAAGQTVVSNSDFQQSDEYKQKVTEINASNMSMMEKLKALSKLKQESK